jgi:hypothetical protein
MRWWRAVALCVLASACDGEGLEERTGPLHMCRSSSASDTISLVCPPGTGGADGICNFVIESRNSGVATVSPSFIAVPESNTASVFTLNFLSNTVLGQAPITVTNDFGDVEPAGVVVVGC